MARNTPIPFDQTRANIRITQIRAYPDPDTPSLFNFQATYELLDGSGNAIADIIGKNYNESASFLALPTAVQNGLIQLTDYLYNKILPVEKLDGSAQ